MVSPEIIITIAQLAKDIYDQAQKAKELKPLCRDLGERANQVESILSNAEFNEKVVGTHNEQLEGVLTRLNTILEEDCQEFIGKISKSGLKNKVKRFVNAGEYTEQHSQIIGKFDAAIGDFNAAINIGMAIDQQKIKEVSEQNQTDLKEAMVDLQTDMFKLYATSVSSGQTIGLAAEDIKAIGERLQALQQAVSQEVKDVPAVIDITVLSAGAKADKVENVVRIGVGIGKYTYHAGMADKEVDRGLDVLGKMAKMGTANLKEQGGLIGPEGISDAASSFMKVTVLEKEAYAKLVRNVIENPQPELKIIESSQPSSPQRSPSHSSSSMYGGTSSSSSSSSSGSSSSPASGGESDAPKPAPKEAGATAPAPVGQ